MGSSIGSRLQQANQGKPNLIIGYGVDLGSTSIKGAALTLEGPPFVGIEVEPFPEPTKGLPPGHFEVDPNQVFLKTRAVLERLVAAHPGGSCLWLCSQMGGLLLADSQGTPLTPYLSWRDQRSLNSVPGHKSPFESLRQVLGDSCHQDLGSEWKPGSGLVLLGCLESIPSQSVPLSLGDWVAARLGEGQPRAHPTLAIGLRNLRIGDWHFEAFDRLGLPKLSWAPWAQTEEVIGQVQVGSSGLDVHPALGDQQTALFGANLGPGELSINASTGAQVSQLKSRFQPGNCQSRAFFDDWVLETITHIPAGRSLHALVELLMECGRGSGQPDFDPWAYIRKTQDPHLVYGHPPQVELSFFQSALGDRGAFMGLSLENLTVGHLFHGALQSMADGFCQCAQRFHRDEPWKTLVLTGGLSQAFPKLRTMVQAKFPELALREPVPGEETLVGLAQLARRSVQALSART